MIDEQNKQTIGAAFFSKKAPLEKTMYINSIKKKYYDQNIKYVEVVNFVTSRTNLFYKTATMQKQQSSVNFVLKRKRFTMYDKCFNIIAIVGLNCS